MFIALGPIVAASSEHYLLVTTQTRLLLWCERLLLLARYSVGLPAAHPTFPTSEMFPAAVKVSLELFLPHMVSYELTLSLFGRVNQIVQPIWHLIEESPTQV